MFDRNSRFERYEKRRKNTKLITMLGIAGGLLAVILIAGMILPLGDNKAQESAGEDKAINSKKEDELSGGEQDSTTNNDRAAADSEGESSDTTGEDDEGSLEDNQNTDNETTQESNDENVIETIQKDWAPVGTEQEGTHVAVYDMESQDWKEMEKAVHLGAGLRPGNSIIWHIGNGGTPQKAIGTITNRSQTEIYRVYIQWVDEKGWKPTKVEVLKENDKKQLYENSKEDEEQ